MSGATHHMMRCSDSPQRTDQVGGSGDGGAAPAGRANGIGEIDVDHLAALLVTARSGRADAFNQLIATCRPVVRRQARRQAWRADDVDDIVQEVLIRLFENAGDVREPRALLGWLSMVTNRVASQIGRRSSRLVPTDLDDIRPSLHATEDQAISTSERREVADGVRAAVARLCADDRRVLFLLEGDDAVSYREASHQLRRPVGSLGPTRQRLLSKLRVDPAVRRLRLVG
jgi:RNA polymerase sigma factor (sigma-70 family)